jgi:PAS domain S-box-containing protein
MKLRLAFGHTTEELFLVTAVRYGVGLVEGDQAFIVTTYAGEDSFLGLAMCAELTDRELFDTVHAVLTTINDPIFPQRWAEVDVDERQIAMLGLDLSSLYEGAAEKLSVPWAGRGFEHVDPLHDFFLRMPMPLLILMGPEHRFTFINEPYVKVLRRDKAESVLGKTIREAMPELQGQPFYKLLDQVYQTGKAFVGHEIPGTMRRETNGDYEDAFFNFIYEPIRNEAGEVEGILAHAMDVTQAVLARQMTAEREAKLFRQWTELEAIYRTAPMGLSLLDAKDFSFLRANPRAAEMIGSDVEEILGRSAIDLAAGIPGAREAFERCARGESQEDLELEGELATSPGVWRSWKVSVSPIFDARGKVSALTLAATETTELKRAEARLIESENFVAGELVAESFVRQIVGPVEELKALLSVVRGEIRRDEALAALAVAEEKLMVIARVTDEAVQRYGMRVKGKVGVGMAFGV